MGLGKTPQTLALLLAEREGRKARMRPSPTLLICPVSVVGNWRREAERFAPSLRVLVHHGPKRSKGRAFKTSARQADLVITTYAWRCATARHTRIDEMPAARRKGVWILRACGPEAP